MTTPTEHSWWSPSATKANMLCPARAKAVENLPNPSSPAAISGTTCHTMCENLDTGATTSVNITEDWQEQAVQDAMTQRQVVFDSLGIKGRMLNLEVSVNLNHIGRPDVFGTVDVLAYEPTSKTLLILDYKFGQGVKVRAFENPQLMTYGLGALALHPDAERIVLCVVQPRIYSEAITWDLSAETLKLWGTDKLLPAIQLAESHNPPFVAGDEQCRWCPKANQGCPTQLDQMKTFLPTANGEAKMDTTKVFGDKEISDLMLKIPSLEMAIKQVKSIAYDRAMAGQTIEHFKLIQKQKNSTWTDPKKVSNYLQRKGLKEADRYKKTLMSPSAAKKQLGALGKLTAKAITTLEGYTTRHVGDIALVAKTAKGEEYTPIKPEEHLPPKTVGPDANTEVGSEIDMNDLI